MMSEKFPLTAADDMVVPGTKAELAKLAVPDPLRGVVASYSNLSVVAYMTGARVEIHPGRIGRSSRVVQRHVALDAKQLSGRCPGDLRR
jgi:hypothetical protein